MEKQEFEMVAKTFHGLEDVLAQELRALGAKNIEPGRRMVAFTGDKALLYRANMCCRTALRILKPIYKFIADTPDALYEMVKEYDWTQILSLDKTFSIDTVSNSEEFTHSRFVTYRVKDAIADFFRDKYGPDSRPKVRLEGADVMINVHISGSRVTISLDSSGESLHKRGYRVAQTEAPINEVLAAGIILKTGWQGQCDFLDPMCGSGTFLVEAAMIAAGINPGIYRRHFAFESWHDFDAELFDSIYNDESTEREVTCKIYGADISPKALAIAEQNIKSAGLARYIDLRCLPIASWKEAPAPEGLIVTNPPYGERIGSEDMEGLYTIIGRTLKHVFKGWTAWIIGYREEYFYKIGLTPSSKEKLYNGALECELRKYVLFDGDYSSYRAAGGTIKSADADDTKAADKGGKQRLTDSQWKKAARRDGMGGKERRDKRGTSSASRNLLAEKYRPKNTRRFEHTSPEEAPENPLELRRNPHALKMIMGRQPKLPSHDGKGVTMRSRRGWKRSDGSDGDAPEQQ